jgi:hypothetical protein
MNKLQRKFWIVSMDHWTYRSPSSVGTYDHLSYYNRLKKTCPLRISKKDTIEIQFRNLQGTRFPQSAMRSSSKNLAIIVIIMLNVQKQILHDRGEKKR